MNEHQYMTRLWSHLCTAHEDKIVELGKGNGGTYIVIYKEVDRPVMSIKTLCINEDCFLVITNEIDNTTIFQKIEERIIS